MSEEYRLRIDNPIIVKANIGVAQRDAGSFGQAKREAPKAEIRLT